MITLWIINKIIDGKFEVRLGCNNTDLQRN